jgi:fructokinase
VDTPGQKATQPCVLLFGEVLVDCFPDKEVEGGAPFNVAHHLQGLGNGLRPTLVTRIGKDARGRHLLDTFKAAGLPTDGVQLDSLHPTGVEIGRASCRERVS